jgi:ABC-type Na+ efflux pump permease subunit
MLRDISCVAWKELMVARRNLKTYVTSYAMIFFIWGIVFPMTMVDQVWEGHTRTAILSFSYLAVLLASGQTISAFVGERMQKTLGTLLSTRLSDAAIYLGKVLAIVAISYVVMLIVLGIHLCTIWYVAMFKLYPSKFPYTALEFTLMLILPIFALVYTSAVGVYISLKSNNIRSQHFLNLFMGAPVMGAFYFVLESPSWSKLGLSLSLFAGVCYIISFISIQRFNRQKLILQ